MSEKPSWKRLALTLENYRAAREGRKTETRRIVNPQTEWGPHPCSYSRTGWAAADAEGGCKCSEVIRRPPGEPGDVVGLTCPHWRIRNALGGLMIWDEVTEACRYAAPYGGAAILWTGGQLVPGWKHMAARFMPAWACLDFALVTDVRAERLQDITEAGAIAEGADKQHIDDPGQTWETHRRGFQALWDSIYAERGDGWDANKWVWAVKFERTEKP